MNMHWLIITLFACLPVISTVTIAGFECVSCSKCFTGGWCIKNSTTKPECLCNYGWTGPNAKYIPNTNDQEWGKNRIRADNCLESCFYNPHFRNITCVTTQSRPPSSCHTNCIRKTGRCLPSGRCRCVRGWIGPNAVYNRSLDRYVADFCDKECPYLGYGISNPGCSKKLKDIQKCNPLCLRNDGECMKETGRCLCPLGWTGPGPSYGTGKYFGRIFADYCLVSCSYTDTRRNDLCVNSDHVRRLQYGGHITG